MTSVPKDTGGWKTETPELAGGINAGAWAEVYTSRHHNLLIGRIAPVRLTPRFKEALGRPRTADERLVRHLV